MAAAGRLASGPALKEVQGLPPLTAPVGGGHRGRRRQCERRAEWGQEEEDAERRHNADRAAEPHSSGRVRHDPFTPCTPE